MDVKYYIELFHTMFSYSIKYHELSEMSFEFFSPASKFVGNYFKGKTKSAFTLLVCNFLRKMIEFIFKWFISNIIIWSCLPQICIIKLKLKHIKFLSKYYFCKRVLFKIKKKIFFICILAFKLESRTLDIILYSLSRIILYAFWDYKDKS